MRTIAVISQKGGVLKTTTVVNVAACVAGQGGRVLVIDADAQANATYVLLRGAAPRRPTLAEVLTGAAPAEEAVVPTAFPGVDLVPAEPADVNVALAAEVGRERRLRAAMADLSKPFDVCLIDTGPARSLLTTNVLNFAAEVVVPIAPGLFGFLGLGQLQADMNQVRRFLENKALTLAGVVLVMTEKNNVSRDFERQVREAFGGLVFKTTIPRAVKFEEANARQQSIFEHAPKSPGATAYKALTHEVMSRGNGQQEERVPAPHGSTPAHDAGRTGRGRRGGAGGRPGRAGADARGKVA
jgi:chromosome partitioning protein